MEPELIDSVSSLKSFLENLPPCNGVRPDLYIDLEGDDLCRQGTLSLVTVFVECRNSVHLIDVTTLRQQAFSTADTSARTLQGILEANDVIKVFFDIRNDSDALFSHYGVRVQGIEDVQLMELATRGGSKRLVNGLARCIESNPDIGYQERRAWATVKQRGQLLFRSGKDGYAIFDRRPFPPEIQEYCVQDVTFLPKLRDSYRAKLCNASWRRIQEETMARIALSQSHSYNGKGRHMALGPPAWQNWHPSRVEQQERSLLHEDRSTGEAAPTDTVATAVKVEDSGAQHRQDNEFVTERLPGMARRHASPEPHVSDDSDSFDVGYSGEYRSEPNSRSQSPRDLTACDSECGYCGRCMY